MDIKSFMKRTSIFLVILAVALLNGLLLKASAAPGEESSVNEKETVTNAKSDSKTFTDKAEKSNNDSFDDEYAFLKIRYKLPDSKKSQLITTPVSLNFEYSQIHQIPNDIRFAASVAAFGQILRGGTYTGEYSYDDIIKLADTSTGKDTFGYRHEFLNLVRLAKTHQTTLKTEGSDTSAAEDESSRDLAEGFANKLSDVISMGKSSGRKAARVHSEVPAASGGSLSFCAPGDNSSYEYKDTGRDKFETITPNPVKQASEEPVSTFSVDVDTAAYTFVRRQLNYGALPQKNAVRIEEMINYFDYDYLVPADEAKPFKPTIAVFQSPWNQDSKLLHIGIKGYEIEPENKPISNLVFLLDVSGSMDAHDKLPLLKRSFRMFVNTLDDEDTVAIVVYAGAAGTVLEPTKVKEKGKILAALDKLHAGGSTAGGEGIRKAYELAAANFNKDGVNRVLLATDGDFNVGIQDPEELKSFIERKRDTGIFLSVLGFGQGNYNDALMQKLAQNGNGNAAYIDSLNEARKVLVEEAGSTLFTIAKDVKIQIEFNPALIAEYRLIGYESRLLEREDFNNDKVDAGDIGSGHSVTAIYEITPVGSKSRHVDDLRYSK